MYSNSYFSPSRCSEGGGWLHCRLYEPRHCHQLI